MEGGRCVDNKCNWDLVCAGGYCVPDDGQLIIVDVPNVDKDVAVIEDTAGPDVPIESLKPSDVEYQKGGLLAMYYGELPNDFDDLGEPILSRIEEDLNLTKNESDLAEINDGEPFAARFQGALYIPKAGTYRIGVTGADSVRCKLGGTSFAEFWKAGILVHAEKELELEEGWYPLDIVYVRSNFLAHFQLWLEGDGLEIGLAGPDVLGYDTALPEEAPEMEIEFSNEEPSFYAVKAQVTANVPVVVSALGGDSSEIFSIDSFNSEHSFSVPLIPAKTQSVTFIVTDVWGREEVIPLGVLTTPDLPEYTSGGLMGEYYEGTNFDNLKARKVDASVNYPYEADGNPLGNFGAPVNPDSFSIRWSGGLYVDNPGEYTLYIGTDDGRRVWLDGVLIADSWYGQAVAYSEVTVNLVEGWHPFTLEMYESGGAAHAYLEWSGPDMPRDMISGANLGFVNPPSDGKKPGLKNNNVWFGPATTTANISLEMTELCEVTLKITSKGEVQVIEYPLPTSFLNMTLTNLPNLKNCGNGEYCGANSKIELILKDLEGNTAIPGTLDLSVNVPPSPTSHVDDFDGNMLDPSWTVVTQGMNDPTANWFLSANNNNVDEPGLLVETGNANGGGDQVAGQYGTFMWNPDWTFHNGRFSAHVFAGDDDGFGLMYGIQAAGADPGNHKTWKYYRFVTAQDGKFTYAAKAFNDIFTVLDSNPNFVAPTGRWIMIELERQGNTHKVFIDGVPALTYYDNSYGAGSVAIYAFAMGDLRVDWVSVESF